MQDSKSGFYAAILFLIWPFLATAAAFKNYRNSWAKNIFWAFCIFYGFTFAIGTANENSDIVRYVAQFQELHQQEMTVERAVYFYQESGEIDVARAIIDLLLSRLTDSQPVLTMVYAIIFGFFFSRNMWYVMDRLQGKLKPISLIMLACLFLVNPIWEINGFRMWTSVHIFLYGLLPYLCENRARYLWISILSIAFHFSMIVPVGVLFMYMVMGNRMIPYFGVFIFTFFFADLDIGAFNNLMEAYAPEILQERTASYREEDPDAPGLSVADQGGGTVWYAAWRGRALRYAVVALLIGLFVTGRNYFSEHKNWMNLFCFSLLIYSAANVLSVLDSGVRFFTVANLVALPLIILYVQNVSKDKVMKRFGWAVTPGLILYSIVSLRIGMYSMSATFLLGNPVVAYFTYEEFMSINEFLLMLL